MKKSLKKTLNDCHELELKKLKQKVPKISTQSEEIKEKLTIRGLHIDIARHFISKTMLFKVFFF